MERLSRQQKAAIVVLFCLFIIAITVFARRLFGAFTHDLAPGEAALYSGLFAAAAVASVRSLRIPAICHEGVAGPVTTLILSLIFVAGLSVDPATMLVCLASIALVIGLAQRRPAAEVAFVQQPSADVDMGSADIMDAGSSVMAADRAEAASGRVSLLRSTIGGAERIEGSMAIEFAAGELTKTLHVPLWPPLAAEPAVECRLEGLEGRVRVPLAKRHGFRIEIRLPEGCDEPLAGTLQFIATAACHAAAA